jgi:hypothetical protein
MDATDTGTALLPYGYPPAQYGYGYPPPLPQDNGYAQTPGSLPSGYGYGTPMGPQNAQSSYAYAPSGQALAPYQAMQPQVPRFPDTSPPAHRPPDPPDRAQSFHERLYHFVALKSHKSKIQDEESAIAALIRTETTSDPNFENLESLYRILELLESRCIPPLEEESFETVDITINNIESKNDEKEPREALGDIKWVLVPSLRIIQS